MNGEPLHFRFEDWDTRWALTSDKRTSKKALLTKLRQFTHFAFFHGTRVEDPYELLRDGLQPSSSEQLDQKARALFLTPEFPHVTEERIGAIIANLGLRDDGKLYLSLDGRDLVRTAGGYLVYGSERLVCIANQMGLSDVLKRRGVPMLVEVHLPAAMIPEGDIEELASRLSSWGRRELNDLARMIDFTTVLSQSVGPEFVRGFRVPPAIYDPYHHSRSYCWFPC